MKRVMFIWLRRWPIDRRRPRRAAPQDRAGRPFALATTVGNQRLVSAVDEAAAGEGLMPGMTLADARALRPDLAVAEADFAGDAAALGRLAAWCGRYSPWTAPCPPDGVWLDVTGCAHLHGGEAGLMAEAVERLLRLGIAGHAAIADSAGAAWAVARHGGARTEAVPEGGIRARLAALPVAALRLAPDMIATLARLGLRRIGDLYPMPRPSLVLRFGQDLAARLDQALGLCPSRFRPCRRRRCAGRAAASPSRSPRRRTSTPRPRRCSIRCAAVSPPKAKARAGSSLRSIASTARRSRRGSARRDRAASHAISSASSRSGSARSIPASASRT